MLCCGQNAFSISQSIKIKSNEQTNLNLANSTPTKLVFASSVGEINVTNVKTDNGNYSRLSIAGYGKSNNPGFPELPVLHKLIEIPLGANVEVKVISYKVNEYDLNERGIATSIVPMQLSQPKCGNTNSFKINNSAGILRGTNIGRLNISPVSYNPVTNTIKVIEDVEFEIYFNDANIALTQELKAKTRSPFFDGLYSSILNNQYNDNTRTNFTSYPVSYVIISDRMFENQLQPFITWKKRKGFTVTEAYTDEIGNTTQQIKDYIKGLYDAGTPENPSPSFVLFVGDIAQIPTWNNGDGVTDRNYVEYTGDLFPEIFYGRFSAENAGHLQPYIDKTLMYEQYTMPNPTYLDTIVMVSGVDASYATNWGNGQINYGTINYFNEDHGIFSHTYLYPASGSSSAQIKQNVSDGITFGNYTAHCSPSGWADPSFVISDIPALTNQDKYGLLIGNCCSSSEYQTVCFAEEIVRAENKGTVGYIGGSNSTYWDEDYYFGVGVGTINENPPPYEQTTLGNYDRSFHDHGEAFAEWFTTMDQIVFAGNLAVSESGSSREQYYWDIYNLMGDPSLMIYYSNPTKNTVSHDSYIMVGATSFTVTAAPYSYVALNRDGENIVSVLSDENGVAVLEFAGFTVPGTAELVITAQNFQPYIEDVQIFAPNGPFCIYESHTLNGNPEFGEQVYINLAMVNYGNDDAYDVNVTISTNNTDVIIEEATELYDTIQINQVVTHDDAFLIQLADNIEDQAVMVFDILAVDNNDSIWESHFEIIANAPKLTALQLIVDDSETGNDNGRLDPGESATIKMKTANTGHCVATDVTATLQAYNPYVTVLSGDFTFPVLGTFGASYAEFDVTVSEDAPEGVFAQMNYFLSSGSYFVETIFYPKVGIMLEDWETGNFSKFDWQLGGNEPWVISDLYPYQGNYDVTSGDIEDNQTSEIWIEYQVMSPDSISFFKKVSSEVDFDKLEFYIDDVLQDEWSGTSQGWTREAYSVNPGVREFRWIYETDYSASVGADMAWLDYIELPTMMVTTVYAGPDNTVCESSTFQTTSTATNYASIQWNTSGTGTFNDNTILTPIYTPSEEDIINENVTLTINIIDVDGLSASDDMLLNITFIPDYATMPEGPEQVDLQVVTQSEYTTLPVQDATHYQWELFPLEAGVFSGNATTATVTWNNQYEGEAWVKVSAVNDCGLGGFSDSLLVVVSNPVGIQTNPSVKTVIAPNPSKGVFVLNISSQIDSEASIVVTNQLGKQVYTNNIFLNKGNVKVAINLSNEQAGLYFISTKTKKSVSVSKLLLIK